MRTALLLGTVATALLASLACSVSQPETSRHRPGEPLPPYALWVDELEADDAPRVVEALGALDGVDSVELDDESLQVSVQMEADVFLYEPEVTAALDAADFELAGFDPPQEAFVTVYEVVASGGG